MSSHFAGEWSSPNITGQPPPPCSHFSLTLVSERRAALFGGLSGSRASTSDDDLFIVDLSRDTVVSVIVIDIDQWLDQVTQFCCIHTNSSILCTV